MCILCSRTGAEAKERQEKKMQRRKKKGKKIKEEEKRGTMKNRRRKNKNKGASSFPLHTWAKAKSSTKRQWWCALAAF